MEPSALTQKITIIEAGKEDSQYWRELWKYRELLYFLTWRDIKVRYRQAVLGISWAVIRPLVTMAIFTLVFSKVAGLKSGDIPYPVMVFTALLPWQFFSGSIQACSGSLVGNSGLLTKVYFPRMIVVFNGLSVSFIDFCINLVMLACLMLWYGVSVSLRIIFLPVMILQISFFSLGIGLWLSALNVKFRDIGHIIPFLIQIFLYVSPVGFSTLVIPSEWNLLFSLNPLVGAIEGFRWVFLGQSIPGLESYVAISCAMAIIFLGTGVRFFRRVENEFADII